MTSGYLELPKITITDELRDLARAVHVKQTAYNAHSTANRPADDIDGQILWDFDEATLLKATTAARILYTAALDAAVKAAAAATTTFRNVSGEALEVPNSMLEPDRIPLGSEVPVTKQ